MPLWLLSLAARIGLPERFLKPLLIALGVVALVTGFGIAKCAYDRDLIAAHDAQDAARIATQAREADEQATLNATARETDFSNTQAAIKEATDYAIRTNPVEASAKPGPAVSDYFDELRRQQASRHFTTPGATRVPR